MVLVRGGQAASLDLGISGYAIQQIRPGMLRIRDPGAMVYFKARQPVVAVDYTLVGGVELLRTLPIGKVARIEYVNSWLAAKRFGTGYGDGVMLIETRADSEPEFAAGPSLSR
ncbi:MAG: hypothetical protein K0S19_1029 [Geminicoccaceae bacterium]|jgi:hypothetical protein|nr:hypothetical protein [Geminicoccaceae bacterium]